LSGGVSWWHRLPADNSKISQQDANATMTLTPLANGSLFPQLAPPGRFDGEFFNFDVTATALKATPPRSGNLHSSPIGGGLG
jgi:hypothetical protein